MNHLANFRRTLYQLKRQYGVPAALYRTTVGATDLQTGAKSETRVKYRLARAVVIPFNAIEIGFYSSALLKAAREFSYGGFQDQDIKTALIDGADLPRGFDILREDYIVHDHKKYEMVKIIKLEGGLGWQVLVNGLRGAVVNEVHECFVFQTIRFTGVSSDGS